MSPFFATSDSLSAHTWSTTGLDAELAARERELIRGAARVGENLADHVEQLASAADDAADAVLLPRRQLAQDAVAQDLAVRDDRGERRAQIVRDVGQELGAQRGLVAQLGDEPRELEILLLQQASRSAETSST